MSGVNFKIPGLDLPRNQPGMVEKVYAPVEGMFSYMGMDHPLMRMLGVAGFSAGAIYLLGIPPFFDQYGRAKSWSVWSAEGEDSIALPWWLFAILLGIFCGVFF